MDQQDVYSVTVLDRVGDTLFCTATYLTTDNFLNKIVEYVINGDYQGYKTIGFIASTEKILEGSELGKSTTAYEKLQRNTARLIFEWSCYGKPKVDKTIEEIFRDIPEKSFLRPGKFYYLDKYLISCQKPKAKANGLVKEETNFRNN